MPVAQFLSLKPPALSTQLVMTNVDAWFSKEQVADAKTRITLLHSYPIPKREFLDKLGKHAGQAWLDGMTSLVDPRFDEEIRWPLWVLTFWKKMLYILRAHNLWTKCQKWLEYEKQNHQTDSLTCKILDDTLFRLTQIGWDSRIVPGSWNTIVLTRLLGEEWLDDDHIDMMVIDLSNDIKKHPNSLGSKIMVAPFNFANEIARNSSQGLYSRKNGAPLLYHYEDLFKANKLEKLYFPIHVNQNHWITGFIDFKAQQIGYGTSLFM